MHALSPNLNGEKNFEEYWMVVFNEKNQGQEKINPNLTKVAATVLSLPFSSVCWHYFPPNIPSSRKENDRAESGRDDGSFGFKWNANPAQADEVHADDEDVTKLRAEFLEKLKQT